MACSSSSSSNGLVRNSTGSRLHGLHGGRDIAMAGQENDGDLQFDLGHPLLQVEPA